ncbi:MAG: nuclease-related domain-containing protein [Mariprofundaceae bacterium]
MSEYLPLAVVVLTALVILILTVPLAVYLRKTSDMRHMKRIIDKHSLAVEPDAVLSDGIDGYFFIDYLILFHNEIIVLKVVPNSGYIFGGEKIDEWTCVENKITRKFKNPLEEVGLVAQRIKQELGFNAVDSCALFGSNSKFPKGVPEGVLQMADFGEQLDALKGSDDSNEAAQQVWNKLIAMVQKDKDQLNTALQS